MIKKVHLPKVLNVKILTILLLVAASNIFVTNVANATQTISGQGNYSAWCNTFYSDCQTRSYEIPTNYLNLGLIAYNEYAAEINANLTVCGAAFTKCMSNPIHSTSSPSGYFFRFDAVIPY